MKTKLRSLSRFLTGMIWLSILPLIVAAGWLAIDSVRTKRAEMLQEADQLAQNFAKETDKFLTVRIAGLELLAASPLTDNPEHLPDLYSQASGFSKYFGSIVILAGTGDPMPVLFNTRVPHGLSPPALSRTGHDVAQTALATGRSVVSDAFIGQLTKTPMVAIAVPREWQDKITHVLLTPIATNALQQRMDELPLPPKWSLTLRDGEGAVLARRGPPPGEVGSNSVAAERFVALSGLSPWTAELVIPASVFSAPLMTAATGLAFVLALAIVAGLLGGTLAGRRLNRQMTALSVATTPEPPPIDIVEIAEARHLIDLSTEWLQRMESRFDATFEQAAFGIALVSLDGHWIRFNPHYCQILGYTASELLNLDITQLTHPDDRAKDLEAKQGLITGKEKHAILEKRYIRKDGVSTWVHLCISLVHTKTGEADCFLAIAEDIQARKNMEKALAASERRYRQLVENANSAIVHCTLDGIITYINPFAQRLFGWSMEEVAGRHVELLVPERDSTGRSLTGLFNEILTNPEQFRNTINENVCRNGRRVWMAWTNRAMLDEEGRVASILTIGNDITELKHADARLREKEDRIRFALETGLMIAWELDSTERATLLSPSQDSIFGYDNLLTEWTYALFLEHVHSEDRDRVDANYRQAKAIGGEVNFECRIWRTDGEMRWIWVAGRHARREGEGKSNLAGIIQDITGRKKA